MAAAATAQSKSDAAAIREAIRFERAKDAAAARQARLDAQSSADRSVANAGRRK